MIDAARYLSEQAHASGESTATTASAADVVPNWSNAVSPGTR